jgi:transposase
MAMRQDQVRFLDGHVRAFAHFDAVPQRIAYDYVPRHIIVVLFPPRLCGERTDRQGDAEIVVTAKGT